MFDFIGSIIGKVIEATAKEALNEVNKHNLEYYQDHLSRSERKIVDFVEESLKYNGYTLPNSDGLTYTEFNNFIYIIRKVDPERAKFHLDKYHSPTKWLR